MRELTMCELEEVNGGDVGAGIATAFLAMGLGLVGGPLSVGAAVLYGASILCSSISIYRSVHSQ